MAIFFRDLVGVFSVSASTPQMVSTAAAPQAEVLLQEIIKGSGIKFAQMTLQRWFTEPYRQSRVMGVDGKDGIGKTSLLKLIHNHYRKVSGIHFDLVIWFTVSTS
jgi:chromosomal replication initiation ATPase DnaA